MDTSDPPAAAVLRVLGLEPPRDLAVAAPDELWRWALPRWDIAAWRGVREIVTSQMPRPAP